MQLYNLCLTDALAVVAGSSDLQSLGSSHDRELITSIQSELITFPAASAYFPDIENLVQLGDSVSADLMSLESQWASLSHAQFSLDEETAKIRFELEKEIPQKRHSLESESKALKEKIDSDAGAIGKHDSANGLIRARLSAPATQSDRHYLLNYGARWGGVNVFAKNNDSIADTQFAPGIGGRANPPVNWTVAMLQSECELATWSYENILAGLNADLSRAEATMDQIRGDKSIAIAQRENIGEWDPPPLAANEEGKHKLAQQELQLLRVRSEFLAEQLAKRIKAIDGAVLDFKRRARRLLLRSSVMQTQASEIATALWTAAERLGAKELLSEQALKITKRILYSIKEPATWPRDGIELTRVYFQIWKTAYSHVLSRESRRVIHRRIQILPSGEVEFEIKEELRFARVKSVAARILEDSNIILDLELSRKDIKFRENENGNLRTLIPAVRHVASGLLPEFVSDRAVNDTHLDGKWYVRSTRIAGNYPSRGITVDLFIAAAYLV